MRMVGNAKFLGVGSGKNDRGEFYRINIFDETGESLRLYCEQEVYELGMLIPFGAQIEITINARSFNGKNFMTVQSIEEK